MKAITTTRSRIIPGIGIAAILLSLLLLPPVAAQNIATVRPEPAALTLQAGETADVAVRLENANDVYGIDVRATFDPDVVEIVDADPDTAGVQMVAGAFPQPDFVALNAADNAAGTLRYVVTQVNPTPPGNGSGVVFSFQLRARAGGATELAISQVEMSDRDGNLLAVTTGLAMIQVAGPTAAPTGIILQPTAAITGAPDEATAMASPVPVATATTTPAGALSPTAPLSGATAGSSAPVATATTAPAASLPTALPPAGATAPAGATPPGGATPPAPANPPPAAESTTGLEAVAATAQPTAVAGVSGIEPPATAIAAVATVPPVVIGQAAGGQAAGLQTSTPAGTARLSEPAQSGLTTAALVGGMVLVLLVAGTAIARLKRRG